MKLMNDIAKEIKGHCRHLGGGEIKFPTTVQLVAESVGVASVEGDSVRLTDGKKELLKDMPDVSLLQILEAVVSLRIDSSCEDIWLTHNHFDEYERKLKRAFKSCPSVNFICMASKPLVFSNTTGIYWITRGLVCLDTNDKTTTIEKVIKKKEDYELLLKAIKDGVAALSEM